MANILRMINKKCIEWTVQTSENNFVYVSKEFSLQDHKFQLEFAVADYKTYLYFKSLSELQLPVIKGILRVVDDFGTLVSLKEISVTNTDNPIWRNSSVKITNSMFTFELIIADLSKDKSVQTSTYLNAGVSTESSSEDFSKLLESGPNHDAKVKCGKHYIRVHQIILSARSEVFSRMLQSDMLEGRTRVIEIKDMDIRCLQKFIRYLYTGVMPELTFDEAMALYDAGDKYAVRSLKLRCSEYLQDHLLPENADQCFRLADAHSDQDLKEKLKTYMLEKKVYLQDELWLPFCESFPKVALEVYRLSHKRKVSEIFDV